VWRDENRNVASLGSAVLWADHGAVISESVGLNVKTYDQVSTWASVPGRMLRDENQNDVVLLSIKAGVTFFSKKIFFTKRMQNVLFRSAKLMHV
jgi:hypothetical protein